MVNHLLELTTSHESHYGIFESLRFTFFFYYLISILYIEKSLAQDVQKTD
jgi:hypothetical protein